MKLFNFFSCNENNESAKCVAGMIAYVGITAVCFTLSTLCVIAASYYFVKILQINNRVENDRKKDGSAVSSLTNRSEDLKVGISNTK